MWLGRDLFDMRKASTCRTRRESSYDRSGANIDFRRIPPGGCLVLLDVDGPGIVTHLWFALAHMDYNYLRAMVLRAWWDGEQQPSIDCPLGDFFGVGHAATYPYHCLLANMVRGTGLRGESTGVNSYVPLPFDTHARIEVVNESIAPCMACYYTVDWLGVPRDDVADAGRFHAQWRRENPKANTPVTEETYLALGRFGQNLDGTDNYTVVDVQGRGRFLGMNLSIDNIDSRVLGHPVGGFGEGDEWIFIDGDAWPPALHGTGTEDYFTDAWGMSGQAGLYAGTSLPTQFPPGDRSHGTCYRFHLLDPIYFRTSLRFTFENGMNNCQANDLASTAYWYQSEPHRPFGLAPVAERLPRPDSRDPDPADEARVVDTLGRTVDAWYDLFTGGSREQVLAAGRGLAGKTVGTAGRLRQQFQAGQLSADQVLAEIEPYAHALARITRA